MPIFFLLYCCCSCNSNLSIDCNIQVTNEFVFFDYCFNGLLINELQVNDTNIKLYPSSYKKTGQYELIVNDSNIQQMENVKIFFKQTSDSFKWRIYQCTNFESLSCRFGDNNYVITDTLKPFKLNTWYLFSFSNPHFEVFAYCDNEGDVSYIKRDLNPNF